MTNYYLGPVQLFTLTVQINPVVVLIRQHYVGEISKLCFYSESAWNDFHSHYSGGNLKMQQSSIILDLC